MLKHDTSELCQFLHMYEIRRITSTQTADCMDTFKSGLHFLKFLRKRHQIIIHEPWAIKFVPPSKTPEWRVGNIFIFVASEIGPGNVPFRNYSIHVKDLNNEKGKTFIFISGNWIQGQWAKYLNTFYITLKAIAIEIMWTFF